MSAHITRKPYDLVRGWYVCSEGEDEPLAGPFFTEGEAEDEADTWFGPVFIARVY